ncbi:MAG: carbon-nitrogen hydrolase, partial [Gammaproteobacteria bacterium]
MDNVPPNNLAKPRSRLTVRQAQHEDIAEIVSLSNRVYAETGMAGYSAGAIRGQLNNFPQGQFVALVNGTVVGYCATFMISEKIALGPHTWTEITGNGSASRHDPGGDW